MTQSKWSLVLICLLVSLNNTAFASQIIPPPNSSCEQAFQVSNLELDSLTKELIEKHFLFSPLFYRSFFSVLTDLNIPLNEFLTNGGSVPINHQIATLMYDKVSITFELAKGMKYPSYFKSLNQDEVVKRIAQSVIAMSVSKRFPQYGHSIGYLGSTAFYKWLGTGLVVSALALDQFVEGSGHLPTGMTLAGVGIGLVPAKHLKKWTQLNSIEDLARFVQSTGDESYQIQGDNVQVEKMDKFLTLPYLGVAEGQPYVALWVYDAELRGPLVPGSSFFLNQKPNELPQSDD